VGLPRRAFVRLGVRLGVQIRSLVGRPGCVRSAPASSRAPSPPEAYSDRPRIPRGNTSPPKSARKDRKPAGSTRFCARTEARCEGWGGRAASVFREPAGPSLNSKGERGAACGSRHIGGAASRWPLRGPCVRLGVRVRQPVRTLRRPGAARPDGHGQPWPGLVSREARRRRAVAPSAPLTGKEHFEAVSMQPPDDFFGARGRAHLMDRQGSQSGPRNATFCQELARPAASGVHCGSSRDPVAAAGRAEVALTGPKRPEPWPPLARPVQIGRVLRGHVLRRRVHGAQQSESAAISPT
jgi:hypothetical protein